MIDPAKIEEQIQPLSIERQSLSPIELEYSRFYGLDFECQMDSVAHYFGYIDGGAYRLASHLYKQKQPAKGTWFVLHGYFDHAGVMTHIIRFFLEQGYDVLAFDLPGHGLSTGARACVTDFSIYSYSLDCLYKHSQTFTTQPCHAFGQSTGSAIITELLHSKTLEHKPLPFQRLVLSAPLVRPYLWRSTRWQLYIARLFISHLPRKFTNNSRDKEFLKRAHSDPLTSTRLSVKWVTAMDRWIRRIEPSNIQIDRSPLIIQGTEDTTVDANHNIPQLQKLYDQSEVLWLKNARHHLPNELKETRQEYFDWLIEQLN